MVRVRSSAVRSPTTWMTKVPSGRATGVDRTRTGVPSSSVVATVSMPDLAWSSPTPSGNATAPMEIAGTSMPPPVAGPQTTAIVPDVGPPNTIPGADPTSTMPAPMGPIGSAACERKSGLHVGRTGAQLILAGRRQGCRGHRVEERPERDQDDERGPATPGQEPQANASEEGVVVGHASTIR